MIIPRLSCLSLGLVFLAGCGTTTIRPDYSSQHPDLQIGGKPPEEVAAVVEPAGIYCVEVREVWHEDGKTPDGERIYTRDTLRRAVSCDPAER